MITDRPVKDDGWACLSLGVILEAIRTYQRTRPPDAAHDNPTARRRLEECRQEARAFLEGSMEPFSTLARLDAEERKLRRMCAELGIAHWSGGEAVRSK